MRRIDRNVHFWALAHGDWGCPTPELAPLYRDFGDDDPAPWITAAAADAVVLVRSAPSMAQTRYLLDAISRAYLRWQRRGILSAMMTAC